MCISKELLSEVLGITLIGDTDLVVEGVSRIRTYNRYNDSYVTAGTSLFYERKSGCVRFPDTVNIYELTHKCKEWAKGLGYYLVGGCFDGSNYFCSVYRSKEGYEGIPIKVNEETDTTEVKAIIKTCEWILKEIR